MKKLIATALALLLAMTTAAMAEPEYAPRITEEKQTLTVMRYIRDIDNIQMDGLWYNDHMEELTNVHIDYTTVSQSDFPMQLNLMYSSGEYPDLVIDGGNNVDLEMYGVDQGVFIPLDDLIENNMPNYKALMALNDVTYKSTMASDGHIYAIGYIADANAPASNNFAFINKNWLAELGRELPTTIDELYDTLLAFKEAHPEGYIWEATFDEMFVYMSQLWGITENTKWYSITNDGKVVLNATQPGYREMVEFIAKCYESGILDPSCITQDSNTKISKLNEDKIGFSILWRLRSMGWDPLVDSMTFLPPFAAGDNEVKIKYSIPLADKRCLIPSTSQNAELAAKWIDYQLTPQMVFEGFYGPEGNLWSWQDGKCTLGPSGDQECVKWAYGVNTLCYMPGAYYSEHFQQPDYRIERMEYCEIVAPYYEKYSTQYVSGLATPTAEEAQEISLLFTTINTVIREKLADFVMHGVTDESWESFQTELANAGADRYIEIYQRVFDDYMAQQ